jgi:uncharacterized protein with FMN-binding domain
MHRPVSIALLASAAILPAGVALTATHIGVPTAAAASATASATATPKKTTTKTTTTVHRYVGPSVDMRWGPVQVTIVVKGKMVTAVSATAPTERTRSAFINNQAIPMLRQEVLQAKTAAKIKHIYGISGATMTSQAFYQSLLAALHQAKLA